MALLCYNKGCGERFDLDKNNDESCLFHPGVPIFHDALKGWSCCRKRTTDFSEFLSIQGCTRGCHSNQKPQEPLRPEATSDKGRTNTANGQEIIYQGPKSAEKLQRERPSSEEAKTKLTQKVSASLAQVLEKLDVGNKAERETKAGQSVTHGTHCKNAGCKTMYQGPDTDMEVCTYHPGAPIFHEGYKYWSCCCIRTMDFDAFLDQKGCSSGRHCWTAKQQRKKVACRHDWHQTGNNVVLTIYAKNAIPRLSSVEANSTVLSCYIQFESDKVFKRDFHLWGVVNVKQSSVSMVPSKVEVSLRKADPVSWGKLEDPTHKAEPEPAEEVPDQAPPSQPAWDIEDDDISDSDEEWASEMPSAGGKEANQADATKQAEMQHLRKEVEEEMKKAAERRRAEEEERRAAEELRRQEEEEGFEDMPDLE